MHDPMGTRESGYFGLLAFGTVHIIENYEIGYPGQNVTEFTANDVNYNIEIRLYL